MVCSLVGKRAKRAILCRKKRDTSRGSPRSFAAQRTLAQDDNQTAPLPINARNVFAEYSDHAGEEVNMRSQQTAAAFLRAVGLLLIVLGLVHLAATPHIPPLLGQSSSPVYQRAVGPTLLNHVLFGILLLPLGYTTWLA